MAVREGNWWSRGWGVVAVLGFALHLGAGVYDAALVAPLWSLDPPQSVRAWLTLTSKPDPAVLFDPLLAIIVVSTLMSWISGLTTRGWRRWWLTLVLIAAGGLAAIVVALLTPCERQLFEVAAQPDANPAVVAALTGEWMQWTAARLAVLLFGFWAAYRAQLAGMLADLPDGPSGRGDGPTSTGRGAKRGLRRNEFAFGDEEDSEAEPPQKAMSAREAWKKSLPARRRTAKK